MAPSPHQVNPQGVKNGWSPLRLCKCASALYEKPNDDGEEPLHLGPDDATFEQVAQRLGLVVEVEPKR